MSETPLSDQTLARLRKLAEGNGLEPGQIELAGTEEKIYALSGITQLVPYCEKQTSRYPGPPRGKDRKGVKEASNLQMEATDYQRKFLDGSEWLPLAMAEIKKAPGQGWGLEGAKVTMPEKSVILAAVSPCPTCEGRQLLACPTCRSQGFVTCTYCQGRGQEFCPNCSGTGQNPQNPAQPCTICNGQRMTPCRHCHASGRVACPACQGRKGIPCSACKGYGNITEEVGLACGVTISFRMSVEDAPAGIRRGLDRLGITNLPKGHADITLESAPEIKPKKEEGKEKAAEEDRNVIRYKAMLPYADMRVRFGKSSRVILVSVFGKKALLMGVPAFLDEALEPSRENLRQAARGEGPLDKALKARAIKEALGFMLAGQGQLQNFRKLYPLGLSSPVMREILQNMDRALKHLTLKMRAGAAIFCGLAAAGLLAALYLTPMRAQLTSGWSGGVTLAFDLGILGALITLSLAALSKAMQFALQRYFPGFTISLMQKTGQIGFGLSGGIALVWLLLLLIAPTKPLWIQSLLDLVH